MVTTPTVSDLVLDTTSVIISALVNVAKISSLPYLQGAASFALNITECIQHVRSNKEAFKRLADDACALVYVLHCAHEQATTKTLHPSFLQNTKELCQTLNEIDTYVRMHASKRMMLRIIQYKSDPGTIEEFRERLKHSLDIFGVKSSISIHDSLSSLDEKVTDLQTLVTQISEATRQDPSSMPPGGPGQCQQNDRTNRRYKTFHTEEKIQPSHDFHRSHGSTPIVSQGPEPVTFPFGNSTNIVNVLSSYHPHLPSLNFSSHPYPSPGLSPSFTSDFAPDNPLCSPHLMVDLSLPMYGALASIGGNHNVYFNSPVTSNSGNITTTTISNSYNSR